MCLRGHLSKSFCTIKQSRSLIRFTLWNVSLVRPVEVMLCVFPCTHVPNSDALCQTPQWQQVNTTHTNCEQLGSFSEFSLRITTLRHFSALQSNTLSTLFADAVSYNQLHTYLLILCAFDTTILLQRQTVLPGNMNSSPMQSLSTQCQLLAILLYNNSWRKLCCQADFFLNCRKNKIQSSRSEQSTILQFSHISTLKKYELELLTPLASKPEQSRAARRVHTASIPWQLRCCSQPAITSTRWYRYISCVSFPCDHD